MNTTNGNISTLSDAWSLALSPPIIEPIVASEQLDETMTLTSNVHRGGHCSQKEAEEWGQALSSMGKQALAVDSAVDSHEETNYKAYSGLRPIQGSD
jgi:hypothetical protein